MITSNETAGALGTDAPVPDFIHRVDALWASYVFATAFPASSTVVLDLAELTGARPSPTVVLQLQHGPIGVAQVLRTMMLRVAEAMLVSPTVRLIGSLHFWIGTQIEPATSFRPLLFWARLVATFGVDPDAKLHRMSGDYLHRHLRRTGTGWVARLASTSVADALSINPADRARCQSLVVAASNFAARHVSTDPRDATHVSLERAACAFARDPTDPTLLRIVPKSALGLDLTAGRLRVVVRDAHAADWEAYLSPAEPTGPSH